MTSASCAGRQSRKPSPGTIACSCRPPFQFIASRIGARDSIARQRALRIAPVAALHVTALAVMAFTETDLVAALAFLLHLGALELLLAWPVAPPAVAAALSLHGRHPGPGLAAQA